MVTPHPDITPGIGPLSATVIQEINSNPAWPRMNPDSGFAIYAGLRRQLRGEI